jgi:hypothetical protein
MTSRFGLRERIVIKHSAKRLMNDQVNLALMAKMATTPEEEEASVQPEEAVVPLGEFFPSPSFRVE